MGGPYYEGHNAEENLPDSGCMMHLLSSVTLKQLLRLHEQR